MASKTITTTKKPYDRNLQSHPLGWSYKVTGVPSTNLQVIKPSFEGCTDRIGKFSNFSHFQVLL